MRSRRKLVLSAILGLVLLGGGLFLAGFFDPRPDPEFEQKLVNSPDEEVEQLIGAEVDRLGITALGLAVLRNDETSEEFEFGRYREGAVMQAASLSKAVAAAVILILAEQEGVGIDEDIRAQISSVDIASLEGGDRPVTLRQLLSHTTGASQSGYPGYPRGGSIPTTSEVIASPPRFFESPLAFDGENGSFRYSGGGYTIAQLWAEERSGKPFDEVASELLLEPLGMTNSTFAQPIEDSGERQHTIVGADADIDPTQALFASLDNSWHNYPEQAAAGLWTTPSDYAVFAMALLNASMGEETALPSSVASLMLTPRAETGWDLETGPMHYGFGVMLETDGEGRVVTVSHTGANAGYRAHFVAKPATGAVAVSMANMGNAAPLNRAIVYALSAR